MLAYHFSCPFLSAFQRYIGSDTEEHRQLFDLIEKMLEYEPAQRIPLAEALNHPFFSGMSTNNPTSAGGGTKESSTLTSSSTTAAPGAGGGSTNRRPSVSPTKLIEQL
jgi:serine/threonine protein kinase